MTRKLQELSDSELDEGLLVFEWEEEEPGEELLDDEEEQLERLSFVNSNTKRELRGAWGRSEIKLAGICRDRRSLLSEKLLMGFPPSDVMIVLMMLDICCVLIPAATVGKVQACHRCHSSSSSSHFHSRQIHQMLDTLTHRCLRCGLKINVIASHHFIIGYCHHSDCHLNFNYNE